MKTDRGFKEVHIGLDNVDTPVGGCTTHAAYRLVKSLLKIDGVTFLDYPNLVRLNPAVPFKTRGNGGVALRLSIREEVLEEVVEKVFKEIESYLREVGYENENASVAVYVGRVPKELANLYTKALTDYVHRDAVKRIIGKLSRNLLLWNPEGRGLVGALASIGWVIPSDCTYELITYRPLKVRDPVRCIDVKSVIKFSEVAGRNSFLNYDPKSGKGLISPHGPDPVIYGVRGEDPKTLLKALEVIKVCEEVGVWVIFRTNQATNAHHVMRDLSEALPYRTGCFRGRVVSKPKVLEGGSVLVGIGNTRRNLQVVFHRETTLTKVATELNLGDLIEICGTVRYWTGIGAVVNGELIKVIEAPPITIEMNPRCPKCGKRMKSAGRGKGWKCVKCGFKTRNLSKERVILERSIKTGLYLPKITAFKHLMKPLERYGREKTCEMVKPESPWVG